MTPNFYGVPICAKNMSICTLFCRLNVTKHLSESIQLLTEHKPRKYDFDNEIVYVDCAPDKTFVHQFSSKLYFLHLSRRCVVIDVVLIVQYDSQTTDRGKMTGQCKVEMTQTNVLPGEQ